MADSGAAPEFPNVSSKLAAPKKLSAYEKSKQAREEKQQRAKAEDEAALRAFQDDFDITEEPAGRGWRAAAPAWQGSDGSLDRREPPGRAGRYVPRSGPGSLGPPPGPPPNLKRKRGLDEIRESRQIQMEDDDFMDEHLGTNTSRQEPGSGRRNVSTEDIEALPAVQLTNLPPQMREDDIIDILNGKLDIHSIEMIGVPDVESNELISNSAIVRCASTITHAQIDTVSNSLSGQYLYCGYFLAIKRYVSSNFATLTNASPDEYNPFGAQKPLAEKPGRIDMRHAPPPGSFAPPTAFGGSRGMNDSDEEDEEEVEKIVNVKLPTDPGTIRAIHVVVDRLLSEPDSARALEIEAMFMALPDVERDKRFAFLYDSTSAEGIYYRYLLWGESAETISATQHPGLERRIFEDDFTVWRDHDTRLPFSDLTELADIRSHADYNSDDDSADGYPDEDDELDDMDHNADAGPQQTLSPMWKAKFAWVLATSPKSTTYLTRSDVAAVTYYATTYANAAGDEVVNLMLMNLEKPFSLTSCATLDDATHDQPDNSLPPEDGLPIATTEVEEMNPAPRKPNEDDIGQAKLVALYLISDVLGSSKTGGLKGAWRYKQLFEDAFIAHKTFERLGQLDKEQGWGRLRQDKWRRSVSVVLDCWQSWDVFPRDVLHSFKEKFLGYKDPTAAEEKERRDAEEIEAKTKQPAWLRNTGKSLQEDDNEEDSLVDNQDETVMQGRSLQPNEAQVGELQASDGPVAENMEPASTLNEDSSAAQDQVQEESSISRPQKQYKVTEDMFADSDDDHEA